MFASLEHAVSIPLLPAKCTDQANPAGLEKCCSSTSHHFASECSTLKCPKTSFGRQCKTSFLSRPRSLVGYLRYPIIRGQDMTMNLCSPLGSWCAWECGIVSQILLRSWPQELPVQRISLLQHPLCENCCQWLFEMLRFH